MPVLPLPPPPVLAPESVRAPLDLSLLAMLRAVVGRPVGDGAIPTDVNDVQEEPPFAILYTGEGERGGPQWGAQRFSDGSWVYQVTSVGLVTAQAQGMADRVYRGVLGINATGWVNPIVPGSGLVVMDREWVSTSGALTVGTLVNVHDRYRLLTTPA